MHSYHFWGTSLCCPFVPLTPWGHFDMFRTQELLVASHGTKNLTSLKDEAFFVIVHTPTWKFQNQQWIGPNNKAWSSEAFYWIWIQFFSFYLLRITVSAVLKGWGAFTTCIHCSDIHQSCAEWFFLLWVSLNYWTIKRSLGTLVFLLSDNWCATMQIGMSFCISIACQVNENLLMWKQ